MLWTSIEKAFHLCFASNQSYVDYVIFWVQRNCLKMSKAKLSTSHVTRSLLVLFRVFILVFTIIIEDLQKFFNKLCVNYAERLKFKLQNGVLSKLPVVKDFYICCSLEQSSSLMPLPACKISKIHNHVSVNFSLPSPFKLFLIISKLLRRLHLKMSEFFYNKLTKQMIW